MISLLKQTETKLSEKNLKFLTILNDFQIQGRYPDYKLKLHKLLTKNYVDEIVKKFQEVRLCLLEKIV